MALLERTFVGAVNRLLLLGCGGDVALRVVGAAPEGDDVACRGGRFNRIEGPPPVDGTDVCCFGGVDMV